MVPLERIHALISTLISTHDNIARTRYTTLSQNQSHQLALESLFFLIDQRLAADKITALVEFDGPAESGLEWGDLFAQLMPIEAISRFQPQGISGAQSRGKQSLADARLPVRRPIASQPGPPAAYSSKPSSPV